VYLFGKKDYQQWRIVERMATDLLFDVEVVGMPIVRDADGLALSSRNAYLGPGERARALALCHGLRAATHLFEGGERRPLELVAVARETMRASAIAIDYVELRDATSLETISTQEDRPPPWVLGVAGFVGKTRLIDNVVWGDSQRDHWMYDVPSGEVS
jgi:pantoate--beta-alanine ligase